MASLKTSPKTEVFKTKVIERKHPAQTKEEKGNLHTASGLWLNLDQTLHELTDANYPSDLSSLSSCWLQVSVGGAVATLPAESQAVQNISTLN